MLITKWLDTQMNFYQGQYCYTMPLFRFRDLVSAGDIYHLFTETEGSSEFCGPDANIMKNFNIICFEPSKQPWKTIEWTLNFSVDAHAHYTHFVIDRSIIFPFWTGWSLAKACSEHDVLWTGTWYAIDQSANRKIKLWHLLYKNTDCFDARIVWRQTHWPRPSWWMQKCVRLFHLKKLYNILIWFNWHYSLEFPPFFETIYAKLIPVTFFQNKWFNAMNKRTAFFFNIFFAKSARYVTEPCWY